MSREIIVLRVNGDLHSRDSQARETAGGEIELLVDRSLPTIIEIRLKVPDRRKREREETIESVYLGVIAGRGNQLEDEIALLSRAEESRTDRLTSEANARHAGEAQTKLDVLLPLRRREEFAHALKVIGGDLHGALDLKVQGDGLEEALFVVVGREGRRECRAVEPATLTVEMRIDLRREIALSLVAVRMKTRTVQGGKD